MKTTTDLLSENLIGLRKERGWSQEKLAEIADVKFDVIQRAEGRTSFPRQDKITAIARALGVHESRLFTNRDELPKPTPEQALAALKEFVETRRSVPVDSLDVTLSRFTNDRDRVNYAKAILTGDKSDLHRIAKELEAKLEKTESPPAHRSGRKQSGT